MATSPQPKIIMNSPFMKRALSVRDLVKRWMVLLLTEKRKACGSGEKELSERQGTTVKPPKILPLEVFIRDMVGPFWSQRAWNCLAVNPSLEALYNRRQVSISIP